MFPPLAEPGVFCHQGTHRCSAGAPQPGIPRDPQHGRPDESDNCDVVAEAQRGDDEAFRTLYAAHAPRLLGYLRALVGDADAEDVASETWARIHTALPTYRRHRGDFRAWTTAIARNQAISHLRHRTVRQAIPLPPEQFPPIPNGDATDHEATEAIGTARILTLVRELPRTQAKAVLLCVVIGLDTATAARVLGKKPSAVRMALHRGLKALRGRMIG